MVLKNVGIDRSIKIGGGREGAFKAGREAEKSEAVLMMEEPEGVVEHEEAMLVEEAAETVPEVRVDKKRDRRRHYRKKRGREGKEEGAKENVAEPAIPALEDDKIHISPPEAVIEEAAPISSSLFSSLLQPPPTLISETIGLYRQNALFKSAFYLAEEEQYKPHDKVQDLLNEDEEATVPSLQEPTFVKEPFEELSGFDAGQVREISAEENEESVDQQHDVRIEIQEEDELFSSIEAEELFPETEAALPLFAEENGNEEEECEEGDEQEGQPGEESSTSDEPFKEAHPGKESNLHSDHEHAP